MVFLGAFALSLCVVSAEKMQWIKMHDRKQHCQPAPSDAVPPNQLGVHI
jgi:hypothetical protein